MSASTVEPSLRSVVNRDAGRVILGAGLVCGVLDITAAFIDAYFRTGRSPGVILQAVASALLGRASFQQGVVSMALGLLLHFAVAFAWTTLFYALSRKFAGLTRYAVASGLIYGAWIYAAMNAIVLPFASWFRSLYLHTPVSGVSPFAWGQFCIHLTCVGLAISLMVKRLSR